MKIADATFLVVDTETTGLDPTKDQVVEIGAVATSLRAGALGLWGTLVRPTGPIPPEVSAVHGIVDEMVADAPSFSDACDAFAEFASRFGDPTFAAHNAEFDAAFLGLQHLPAVCTKRLAAHLWPSAPNHRNQTLRYWRGHGNVETFGIGSHRALGDALVTGRILLDELEIVIANGIAETVDALIEYAESPIVFETWPFGKHKGAPIAGTDPSYVRWCLRDMEDLSRDMRFTLEQQLKGVA